MEVEELLSRAWAAVEASGVPEPVQGVALKEAIDFLRSENQTESPPPPPRQQQQQRRQRARGTPKPPEGARDLPDEASAFNRLADESGVDEADLRDVLQFTRDGEVHVTPPTRSLGNNLADQARTVITLVASARRIGLGENPVSAAAVRAELERKRVYNRNKFASQHLGPLKGFNAGGDYTEIVLTSKWVEEFKAAVERVHGRESEEK